MIDDASLAAVPRVLLREQQPRPVRRRPVIPADRRRRALLRRMSARRTRPPGSPWQRAGIIVAILVVLVPLGAWALSGVAFAVLDSVYGAPPDPHAMSADSVVLDRNGAVVADLHPNGDTRLPVHLDQVARSLVDATVSVEDRNFWNEGSIDEGRLVSAAWQNLVNGGQQGASTITEQLAKVLYLDSQRSLDRKLHEVFVARRLSTTQTKQQILEQYLNDISYGHGATGIEAAARTYFGIPAAKLDLAQSALLAGLPNAPALLDPLLHPEAAAARQRLVLAAMVATGTITPEQSAAAAAERLAYADGSADNVDLYPAFAQRVAQAVHDLLGLDVQRAGLTITTTLDSGLQKAAQDAVTSQVRSLGADHVTDGALVAIDPGSGDIVAYVGNAGPDFPASQIDMASTTNARQPGSTMKLFTYSAAIADRRVTMTTPVVDAPYTLPKGGPPNGEGPYQVNNYDLRYHGTLPIKQAFANSLNVPAVKVEQIVGVPRVVQQAQSLGVTTLRDDPASYGASLTLGTYPVPLWQMAQTGAIFAAGGVLHPARELLSVKDGDGHELQTAPPAPRQAVDPGVAFIMNTILRTDANRVMSFGAHSDLTLDGHLVAAKTGTTQDFRDNLTVGWTPHLAIATWVGNADDSPMQGTTGITGAAPIWHAVMTTALANRADDWQTLPSDVYQQSHDWYLQGTDSRTNGGTTDVRVIGGCRYWTYNGGHYYWCGNGPSPLPGDPGPGAAPGGGIGGVFGGGLPVAPSDRGNGNVNVGSGNGDG